ncbi:MAG: PDZ domain-containing protein [Phycisphaerae bacterium]
MKRLPVTLLPILLLPVLTLPACGPDQLALRAKVDRAVDEVYPALVRIHVITTSASGGRIRKSQASGSGVIITPDGYIVTNHHVAGKADRIVCRLASRREVEAELIGTDAMTDIAVLKLDLDAHEDLNSVPHAQWGDSEKVKVGDTVLAMGSPAGLSQSVTMGVVSNTEMIAPGGGFHLDGENVGILVRWIGHDAQIWHGNSGGPLVDLQGRVIGINEVGIGGIGGAIPSALARDMAAQLIETGRIKRSWTGLDVQTLLKQDQPSDIGILVGGVLPDSPAAEAGLQAGDVITHVNGKPVHAGVAEELPLFHQVVLSAPVGSTLEFTYRRDGQVKTADITTVQRDPARGKSIEIKSWGITALNVTRTIAAMLGRKTRDGVAVHTLRAGGPAAEGKPRMVAGDIILKVNDTPVNNVQQLLEITRKLTADTDEQVPVLVTFVRSGSEQLLTVLRVGKEAERDKPIQAKKAWLGVETQVLTRELAKMLDLTGKPGVRVTKVIPETNAAEKLEVGDIILAIDGMSVDARDQKDYDVFRNMIRQYRIGSEVKLNVVRDGKRRKVSVELESHPVPAAEMDRYENDAFEFAVREMTFPERAGKKERTGVIVDEVATAGWAALAGLRSGDVILRADGKTIDEIGDLKKILTSARRNEADRVVLFIRRKTQTRYLELEPNWDLIRE